MKTKSKKESRRQRGNLAALVLSLVANAIVLTALTSRPDHYDVSATFLWVMWPVLVLCLIGTTWLITIRRP